MAQTSPGIAVIVPTLGGGPGLRRLARSLAGEREHRLVIVDNEELLGPSFKLDHPDYRVIPARENLGFGRAVNLAAASEAAPVLIVTNDDCTVEPGFVDRLAMVVEAGPGRNLGAGVLLRSSNPEIIDSAGVQVDNLLMPFDYLNGTPKSELNTFTPPPFGPTGGAMSISRDLFTSIGGFDERFIAYHEDVDLVIRARLTGARPMLCVDARAVHEHSATLGSGSASKNYLMGFGRGLVLRKWSVLRGTRTARILASEALICMGQLVIDRNMAGVKGRIKGLRVRGEVHPYPDDVLRGATGSSAFMSRLRRRMATRRARRP